MVQKSTSAQQTTKADEIGALVQFALQRPAGSYLSMLFTPDFMRWVEQRISEDTPPDILAQLDHEIADGNAAKNLLLKANDRCASLTDRIERERENHQRQVDQMKGDYNQCANALEAARERADALRTELDNTNTVLALRERQLVELKAQLFDLLVGDIPTAVAALKFPDALKANRK